MHYCAFLFLSCALMPDWWVKHWFLTKNPIIKYQRIQQKIICNFEFDIKINKKVGTFLHTIYQPAKVRTISAEYSKAIR